jgi:tripeptidyl-peptidase I
LSIDQVHQLVKPVDGAVELVQEWLLEHGISADQLSSTPSRDFITVPLEVNLIEDLLQAQYFRYEHEGISVIRTLNWSLPHILHEYVELIQPTTSFFHLPSKISNRDTDGPPSDTINLNQLAEDLAVGVSDDLDLNHLPDDLTAAQACNTSAVTTLCLRTLYGTLHYRPQATDRNRMALVNYLGEFNNRSDIHQFLQTYRPDALSAASTFSTVSVAGAIHQQTPATPSQLSHGVGREGNLDAQIMLGISHPTLLTAYSVGGSPPPFHPDTFAPSNTNEPYLTWLNWILAQPNLPSVISTSYGDIEHTVPESYARRVCAGFAQLGARGVSVVFGSGDHGVGHPGDCKSNDGKETPMFQVNFPDSCPWITSVGATKGINPEVVAVNDNNGFASGGGFSGYFSRPRYQETHDAVIRYLDSIGSMHNGLFNPSGRGFPDVATQGYRYVTVWNGMTKLVDGTSASTATFAAMVALVNDALAAEGKPPMGFLNPWLYSKGYRAFTDVVVGSNRGCNTTGFPAREGWDAATGFGTPVSIWLRPCRLGVRAIDKRIADSLRGIVVPGFQRVGFTATLSAHETMVFVMGRVAAQGIGAVRK